MKNKINDRARAWASFCSPTMRDKQELAMISYHKGFVDGAKEQAPEVMIREIDELEKKTNDLIADYNDLQKKIYILRDDNKKLLKGFMILEEWVSKGLILEPELFDAKFKELSDETN